MDEPRMHTNERESDLARRSEIPKSEAAIPEFLQEMAAALGSEIDARLDRYSADLGYTTAYCFSVANGFTLHDPRQWLSAVQQRLRQPFPEPLIRSIVAKNRPVLGGGMQSCYLAQMKAAIARRDLISLNHRVADLPPSSGRALWGSAPGLKPQA
jgi:hypothetical protein